MAEQEKRRYPRFDVDTKVHFKKLKDADAQATDGFVKDISAEGFCFGCSKQLSPGEILQIEIAEKNMPDVPLRVKGEIVWTKKVSDPQGSQEKDFFLTGVKILGIRDTDEARFAMLYCERVLAELKQFYRI